MTKKKNKKKQPKAEYLSFGMENGRFRVTLGNKDITSTLSSEELEALQAQHDQQKSMFSQLFQSIEDDRNQPPPEEFVSLKVGELYGCALKLSDTKLLWRDFIYVWNEGSWMQELHEEDGWGVLGVPGISYPRHDEDEDNWKPEFLQEVI